MTPTAMQLAALALHLEMLDLEQYREVSGHARTDADALAFMTERGWLQAADVAHLQHVIERCLAKGSPSWLMPTDLPGEMPTWDATPPPPPSAAPGREPMLASAYRRFRVENLHATGGIGRVWIASDDALGRKVALKDLRPELSEPGHQVRFVEEAKITARLEHPGIVPVYELARDEHGQPFYVMRFVKGTTLSEAIKRYHEARRKREAKAVDFLHLIESFRAICQTVAYAHNQGVLHRDLKPANVILGDFGEVLVLDWGLAKSGGPAATPSAPSAVNESFDPAGSATQAGQILGTPAYMSPEQASGQPERIDARSDVWGLGAILYEILTGVVPFRGANLEALLRQIRDDPPADPRTLHREAPLPLVAVCLKALAKSPTDRYLTAAALAQEIGRFLADEPVEARREPITQRAARWARRHRALVAGASALLVTAVVALSISTVLIGREYTRAEENFKKAVENGNALAASNELVKKEHARAEANLEKALDTIERFYVHVSENRLLNEDGMQPLRADLLRDAVRYGQEFAAANAQDPRRRADLARFRLLLGRVLDQTGEPGRALEKLEEAKELFTALRKESPDSVEYLRGEALAELNIGIVCRLSDPQRARKAYESARDKFEQLVKRDADSAIDREKLMLAYNNLGGYHDQENRLDHALEQYTLAQKHAEFLVAKMPENRLYQQDLAGIFTNLGSIRYSQRKLVDARTWLEKGLDIRQKLAREKKKDLWLDEHLANSHQALGLVSLAERERKQAEKHFREALALRQLVVIRNPTVPRYRRSLALDRFFLSRSLAAQDKTPEALAEVQQAIDIQKALAEDHPENADFALLVGRLYLGQGYFLYDDRKQDPENPKRLLVKDPKAAIESFSNAILWIATAQKVKPSIGNGEMLEAYWKRAMTYVHVPDYARAIADYDRALELADDTNRDQLEDERRAAVSKRGAMK